MDKKPAEKSRTFDLEMTLGMIDTKVDLLLLAVEGIPCNSIGPEEMACAFSLLGHELKDAIEDALEFGLDQIRAADKGRWEGAPPGAHLPIDGPDHVHTILRRLSLSEKAVKRVQKGPENQAYNATMDQFLDLERELAMAKPTTLRGVINMARRLAADEALSGSLMGAEASGQEDKPLLNYALASIADSLEKIIQPQLADQQEAA